MSNYGTTPNSNTNSSSTKAETASIASYSSSSALLKDKDMKSDKNQIDTKKLQDQLLKSQIKFHM